MIDSTIEEHAGTNRSVGNADLVSLCSGNLGASLDGLKTGIFSLNFYLRNGGKEMSIKDARSRKPDW